MTKKAGHRAKNNSHQHKNKGNPLRKAKVLTLPGLLIAIAAIAGIVGFVTWRSGSDTSNAQTTARSITNLQVTSSSTNLLNSSTKTLTIQGNNLNDVSTITINNQTYPVSSVSTSGDKQTLTVQVPSSECTASTAACNPNTGTGNCPSGTAGCRSDLNISNIKAQDSQGKSVGNVSSATVNNSPPSLSAVSVSGNRATFRGSNFGSRADFTLGNFTAKNVEVDNDINNTQTATVTIERGSCLYSKLSFLSGYCHKVSTDQQAASATSATGQKSNVIDVDVGAGQAPAGTEPGDSGKGTKQQGGTCVGQACGTPCRGWGRDGCKPENNLHLTIPNNGETWNYGSSFTFAWHDKCFEKGLGGPACSPNQKHICTDYGLPPVYANGTYCQSSAVVLLIGDSNDNKGQSCLALATIQNGRHYEPNLVKDNTDISITVTQCDQIAKGDKKVALPSGYYTVGVIWTAMDMVKHCTGNPEHPRCTGLPAKAAETGSDTSDKQIYINNPKGEA